MWMGIRVDKNCECCCMRLVGREWGGILVKVLVFCFFKQKTAYEMLRSLVGSEMCIRDSHRKDPMRRNSCIYSEQVQV